MQGSAPAPATDMEGTFIMEDGDSGSYPSGPPLSGERAPPPHQPGEQLGSYRLVKLIGEGGMGYVYEAEHARLGRRVALKLLRPEYAQNPQAVSRFFGEARAVNQICHENIVEITDFIENEGEEKYYIMELLQGGSLRDLLSQHRHLPLARAMAMMVQVAEALATVHSAGTVHRDLKPDNIYLVERSGQKDFVKLLDFGVAKLSDPLSGSSPSETQAGAILGTPEYMSPEQAGGDSVDYRTDLYALGVILYETVTGKKPFTGKNFGELVVKHMTVEPTRPSRLADLPQQLPAALEDLIISLLEKQPENRPQSMAHVAEILRTIAGSEALPLATYVPPPRSRTPMVLAGGAAVILLPLALWALGSDDTPPPTEDPAVVAEESPPVVEPKMVRILLATKPAQAQVFLEGSDEPLGMTPYNYEAEQADAPVTFELRKEGYETATETVVPDADAKLTVQLAKSKPAVTAKQRRRPPRRPPRKPTNTTQKPTKKKGMDRTGVIDPFAD